MSEQCSCCKTTLPTRDDLSILSATPPVVVDDDDHDNSAFALCTPCFDAGCCPVAPGVEIPEHLAHVDVRDCQRTDRTAQEFEAQLLEHAKKWTSQDGTLHSVYHHGNAVAVGTRPVGAFSWERRLYSPPEAVELAKLLIEIATDIDSDACKDVFIKMLQDA